MTFKKFAEWREEDGDVLWFHMPITESPYVGNPNDMGYTVEMHGHKGFISRGTVGGWPFTEEDEPHLLWSKIEFPS